MPVGNVLVGDSGCDVEHDYTALAVDVVPISETTKFLLSCGIPDIELYSSVVLVCHQPAESNLISDRTRTVEKPSGCTSTPRVAIYFFSNSPVKWRLTKVVYYSMSATVSEQSIKRRNLEPEHVIERAHRAKLWGMDRSSCSGRKQSGKS